MIDHALRLPDGSYVVPGNRWDLVPDDSRRARISVVVPYFEAPDQLRLVLEALKLQTGPEFEVVVADDGSSPPLDLRPDEIGPLTVVQVRQEDQGFRAAAARNLAVRASSGEVLCFLDQDTIPEPGYLQAISRLPSHLPDALVVGRREHADLTGWSPPAVRAWLTGSGEGPAVLTPPHWLARGYEESGNLLRAGPKSYQYVISAVMCCGRDLFDELGGFDESFTRYGGEDWDFAYRAWNAGAVLAHAPDAVAWHDGPDWAGRGTAAERYQTKQAEREALTRRIPPDHPQAGAPPAIVVTGPLGDATASGLNVAARRGDHDERARWQVTLGPGAGHRELLEELMTADAGEIRCDEAGFHAVATRARRRAERWARHFPDRDLVADLFGAERRTAPAVAARP
ncbi:GT2 family glycosyltransferase [Kineosporia succinea]|uniref:GT2 family glycosyltransferase n=1 Tax=Kineosporia succinea TaxID=84632 RepID=A0ABT9PET1_9ACTN|nr:glycosyltransferase [Kineosporia succinea]MDP9831218.1 GT2 family glycosyltransferase [Kineosporia succinea]